jgi:hypothetical protein
MTRRRSRLVFIALAVYAATFYFSCTQPDDILTQVSSTEVYLGGINEPGSFAALKVQNLPTNPEGMIYELWVANQQDTVSLGKFGYHRKSLTFRDENGNERPDTNYFVLEGDIFDYSHIFVSIETNPDDLPLTPGPIMIIDDVTEPSNDPIKLRFPLNDSLTTTAVSFNMETPSDSVRDSLDGFGVWFSVYLEGIDSVRDTLSLDSFVLITKQDTTLKPDTFTTYLTDIVNDTAYDTIRIFGLDTMLNMIVRFDSVLKTDTTWPYTVMDMSDTGTVFYYTVGDSLDIFHYDKFLQFDYGLPNYSAYGWKYKGWVVSPEVPTWAVGKITLPAYSVNTNPSDSLIPGVEGGLLTTGTFTEIAESDSYNPYSVGPRVPPFPGEDFLVNLPGGLTVPPWEGLVPKATGNSGTIFITLEPVNFVTDTTNFPLFVLIAPIPTAQEDLIDLENVIEQFDMKNLTNVNSSTSYGFPNITVGIRRY